MVIRPATLADEDGIWAIIGPTIRAGETYTLDRDLGRDPALAYWMNPEKETFVADDAGVLAGTYFIRPNQLGGGRHVCNCGYMTGSDYAGRGIAREMFAHSVARARAHGYRAMQFNFVVSVNERAVRLWQSLGFEIVGRLPGAFLHPSAGYVDALVMYLSLSDDARGHGSEVAVDSGSLCTGLHDGFRSWPG
jgi:ribosomal protein S18 acetylase RimI-like enzyme